MILVINGSPKPGGNLQRILERVAEGTGRPYEMVSLAKLNISPCIGCVKCAKTQRCVRKDDMAPLYDKIEDCEALIVGGVSYFARANGFTRNFLERMFALRHMRMVTKGKPAVVVAVGGTEAEPVIQELEYHLGFYFLFNVVGSVKFNSATPPCYSCGFGTECKYGRPARMMSEEEFAAFHEITPDMFKHFEDFPAITAACDEASAKLREASTNP